MIVSTSSPSSQNPQGGSGEEVKNQGVFVKHYSMPPAETKMSKKAIFSFKVKVKVTRQMTLLSGRHLWSMHAKYEVSISYGSKVIAKVRVDNRQTDRQTDKQTDMTKTICPDHSIRGHKKLKYWQTDDGRRAITNVRLMCTKERLH